MHVHFNLQMHGNRILYISIDEYIKLTNTILHR